MNNYVFDRSEIQDEYAFWGAQCRSQKEMSYFELFLLIYLTVFFHITSTVFSVSSVHELPTSNYFTVLIWTLIDAQGRRFQNALGVGPLIEHRDFLTWSVDARERSWPLFVWEWPYYYSKWYKLVKTKIFLVIDYVCVRFLTIYI